MAFRRTRGIVTDSLTSDPTTEADVIMTAVILGFAAEQVANDTPIRFDMEPGGDLAQWEGFEEIVGGIDRAVTDYLIASGREPKGRVRAGLCADHTKGAVIMGVYQLAGQSRPVSVGDPELTSAGRKLYERIRNEEIPQYTGRGAYSGFVDNHNTEGETAPVGPRPTAQFLAPEVDPAPDHADTAWAGPRWLPPEDSAVWTRRRRLNRQDSVVPWGMIGGDKAQEAADAGDGNKADEITAEMRDRWGMVFNGEPTERDVVGYTHGMIQCIYKAYALGPSCSPYEITVGEHTTKLASCLPCTLFMVANGYPPTSIHLGRGESWVPLFQPYNPGETTELNERGVVRDLNYSWCLACKSFLETGLRVLGNRDKKYVAESHRAALDALEGYLHAHSQDNSTAAMLVLDAITVHDNEANRISRTLHAT